MIGKAVLFVLLNANVSFMFKKHLASNISLCTFVAQENSRHLTSPPLVFARNDVSVTIPFWWRATIYNNGQKSWDTFAFLRHFPIHTGLTPPLTPQTKLDAFIQYFFWRVSTLYRLGDWAGGRGRRDNCKKNSKRMHCFMREPRNDRKIRIFHYCPKDLCPWL